MNRKQVHDAMPAGRRDQREKAKAEYVLERKKRFRKGLFIRIGIILFALLVYLCLRYFYL